MSNAEQFLGTIAGAAIGFVLGGPAGAMYGFQIGLLASSAIFPTELPGAEGPRIEDFDVLQAEPGAPVPLVFGMDAVIGFPIYTGPPREESSTEEVGGKGGPTQDVTSFTYFQTIAIGLCEGPVSEDVGVARIWENDELVYDARPQQDHEATDQYDARLLIAADYADTFVLYRGTAHQEPDPTIEEEIGEADATPAWRDLAYLVYPERQLKPEQGGDRHPLFKVELSSDVVALPKDGFLRDHAVYVTQKWAADIDDPGPTMHPLTAFVFEPGGRLSIYAGMATPFGSRDEASIQVVSVDGVSHATDVRAIYADVLDDGGTLVGVSVPNTSSDPTGAWSVSAMLAEVQPFIDVVDPKTGDELRLVEWEGEWSVSDPPNDEPDLEIRFDIVSLLRTATNMITGESVTVKGDVSDVALNIQFGEWWRFSTGEVGLKIATAAPCTPFAFQGSFESFQFQATQYRDFFRIRVQLRRWLTKEVIANALFSVTHEENPGDHRYDHLTPFWQFP